ncbi:B-cell receptor CD22 [Patella vulgata]|uniref:B-cell receptor CD22 n=1 Tax=Patella vulgata TaxID=6465 RepID=UPI0024A8418A|nr:B-cell receptor CD22 [Patella vulgata]
MVTNITCYTGTLDPNVSFTWYLDSTDNLLPEQTSGVIDGATASILQLTSTKHLNNKTLYCSATNQCGTGNTDNITLDIRYRPTVHIAPSTSPYKIIEGTQLTLTCTVDDSNPQPTSFTWSKDGISITGQMSSVFRLTSVQRSQAGQYTCTANNVVGTGTSTSVEVDVLYPPTVSTPSIYKILESDVLSVTCSSIPGNPTVISYRWTGPGGYSSTGVTLRIPDIKRNQTGGYTCTATNIMIPTSTNIQQTGTGTSQTTIDVLSAPDVPKEFILDSLSHSSICIRLKPGFDGGDTQKFIFEHSVDNKTWTFTPTVELTKEGDVLNGCIENLNPDTEYFVRVIASNRYGSSKPVHLVIRQPLRTSANPYASGENTKLQYTAQSPH